MSVCIYTRCMTFSRRSGSIRFPGFGVTDSCVLTYGSWEIHLDLLEEKPVFLAPEP